MTVRMAGMLWSCKPMHSSNDLHPHENPSAKPSRKDQITIIPPQKAMLITTASGVRQALPLEHAQHALRTLSDTRCKLLW